MGHQDHLRNTVRLLEDNVAACRRHIQQAVLSPCTFRHSNSFETLHISAASKDKPPRQIPGHPSAFAQAIPRGPRVTPTAAASLLIPLCILARESESKTMSLASARTTCQETGKVSGQPLYRLGH